MNDALQQYARDTLKDGLSQLPAGWQNLFKRMYGGKPTRRGEDSLTLAEIEARPIDEVVDEMPAEKLDWAMQQVERSIAKLASRPGDGGRP